MKNLKISTFLLLGAILLGSCKKDYLETSSTVKVDAGNIFKTTANAMAAVEGIHRLLYIQYNSAQDQGGQSKNMIDMDMLGEDLVNTSAGNNWFISTYKWQAHRSETAGTAFFNFQFYYDIITNANNIITQIDAAVGPDADKKLIKGQALAYRGWSYFQMIQLYGKRYQKGTANDNLGLSIVLAPTTEGTARSTVAQVYDVITNDLDSAIINLTGAAKRPNASEININVAKGMRARVALTMQDWTKAAQLASEARAGFTLMSNAQYQSGFNDYTNPEWMWGSHQIQEQTTYFYGFFAYMSATFSSTNIRGNPKAINSLLYNTISSTDIRKTLWDPTGANTAFPTPAGGARFPYMNRKFLTPGNNGGSSIGDVPLMRAAEMYLIEAEAKARNNDNAGAQAALFTLASKRDPSYVKSTNTGEALITEIMNQRRAELWGEGFRFYDLKRLDLPLNRNGANHIASVASVFDVPAGDPQWQFLIPRAELNTNSLAVQNP